MLLSTDYVSQFKPFPNKPELPCELENLKIPIMCTCACVDDKRQGLNFIGRPFVDTVFSGQEKSVSSQKYRGEKPQD